MKVKWGIIGANGIAKRRTIPGLVQSKNAELIALMDVVSIDELAKEYNVKYVYDNVDALLENPNVDAVYIGTPVYLHFEQFLKAAKQGKHILLEKPLSLTLEEAEKMCEIVSQKNIKAMEGYMMRFHPFHQKAKKMLEEKQIGNIVMARAQLSCWYPDIDGAWRQDPSKSGGGALIDMASHCYNLLTNLVGKIKEVMVFTNTLTFKYPVEDSSTTLLRFENGAHGVVDTFFNVPDSAGQDRLEIYGNKGSIQAEGTISQITAGKMCAYINPEASAYDAQQEKSSLNVEKKEIFMEEAKNMYTAEIEYLSECIIENKKPEINTIEQGLQILKVIKAAYESAKTGKKITI
ncbi:MAG: Gfo/Idh/MocA family oxidoreductase [bacterium]